MTDYAYTQVAPKALRDDRPAREAFARIGREEVAHQAGVSPDLVVEHEPVPVGLIETKEGPMMVAMESPLAIEGNARETGDLLRFTVTVEHTTAPQGPMPIVAPEDRA